MNMFLVLVLERYGSQFFGGVLSFTQNLQKSFYLFIVMTDQWLCLANNVLLNLSQSFVVFMLFL